MLKQINEQKIDRLVEVLTILAEPIRMRIVLELTKPASMSTLQQHLQIGQVALLHHLTQMLNNGFLSSQHQNDDIYYSLTDIALNKAVKLLLFRRGIS